MLSKTSTLPLLLVTLAGGTMAIFSVFSSAEQDIRDYEAQQTTAMTRSATDAAGYIERFVERRTRLVEAFAQDHIGELTHLTQNPDDTAAEETFSQQVNAYFPKHFAYTARRMDGEFIPDDLGEFVGDACRADMDQFADTTFLSEGADGHTHHPGTHYTPVIHPQPFNYHFDITAPWTATDGSQGLLMVSFKPDQLVQMLRAHELPFHGLMLFRSDTPALIEVTSSGWRETLERTGRLDDSELASLTPPIPVPGTRWQVAYLPSATLFAQQADHIREIAYFNILVIGTFMALLTGWYFFSENARRLDANEKAKLLRQSSRDQEALETVIDVVPLPIYRRNSKGETDLVNKAYAKLLERPKEDVRGKTLEELFGKDTAGLIKDYDTELLQAQEKTQVYERQVDLKDGSGTRTIVFHKTTVQLEGDTEPSILGAAIDVTEERKLREDLELLATTDPLTGIANRRKFTETADTELVRATRYKHPACLVLLDVDHFKSVNDTHGHDFGDAALKQIASLLAAEMRTGIDLAARIGGEEFALVLPETGIKAAFAVAERLRRKIERTPITYQDRTTQITVSLGIAAWPGTGSMPTLGALMSRADKALYAAKNNGRNRTELSSGTPAVATG